MNQTFATYGTILTLLWAGILAHVCAYSGGGLAAPEPIPAPAGMCKCAPGSTEVGEGGGTAILDRGGLGSGGDGDGDGVGKSLHCNLILASRPDSPTWVSSICASHLKVLSQMWYVVIVYQANLHVKCQLHYQRQVGETNAVFLWCSSQSIWQEEACTSFYTSTSL